MFKGAEHTDIKVVVRSTDDGPCAHSFEGWLVFSETAGQLSKCLTSSRLPSQQDSAEIIKVALLGEAIC